SIARDYPDLRVVPIAADFTKPFALPDDIAQGHKVGFFPGSTIGNFNKDEATEFLTHAARLLGDGGGLLIGADLKKDPQIINAAYNDKEGITEAFILNLLRRVNREIGGTFDARKFGYEASYNADAGRAEIFLVSREKQSVRVDGEIFHFGADERIHVENSHKYGIDEFQGIARQAGFAPQKHWVDAKNLFSIHYLAVLSA
ncbi:MAG: L-histidine N(alpha)-methyltransferase, partial [Rhodospirillaceae bacterium]